MEHAPAWLTYSLIYLAAAVIAVPLSRALGLGAILGYLAAGIAIGPWGLKLVPNVQDVLHFAEFGVVLMVGGNLLHFGDYLAAPHGVRPEFPAENGSKAHPGGPAGD